MDCDNVVEMVGCGGLDGTPVDDSNRSEVNGQNVVLCCPAAESLKQSEVHVMNHEDKIEEAGHLACCVLLAGTSLPETDGNNMIHDGPLVEASEQSQGDVEGEEKGVKKVHTTVSDDVSLGELKQPKVDAYSMDIDSFPVVASRQSHKNKRYPEQQVKKPEIITPDVAPAEGAPCLRVDADIMILNGSPAEESKQSQPNVKGVKKQLKRKRASDEGNVTCQDKESLIRGCHREMDGLFEYYKEVSGHKLNVEDGICSSNNQSVITSLLEESNLSFTKLVEEIYEKLKAREGITLSLVRSAVLSVGQRMMYGINDADANVLEDESEKCLWCWETRDMKLLPRNQRGILSIRRTARKKIQERIAALSAMLSVLSIPESLESCKGDALRESEKLAKVLNGDGIRSLVERLKQRNDADMAEKDAKLKEKELIKEMERNKRDAEKEKKRLDRELQKEKVQSEKERKRLQEEAEKVERRREKEEAELRRQLKKQQEEAERVQRRREKDEAVLKKQISIQKQASIMERFLKSQKSNKKLDDPDISSSTKCPIFDSFFKKEAVVDATTSSMDFVLSQKDSMALEDLRKLHFASWHKLSRRNRSCCWGTRCKPKIELIKDLKLQSTTDTVLCHNGFDTGPTLSQSLKRKLLQFDKCHRPAYYGTWCKKSATVGPCHPFTKDVDLDYDVDSDGEWEEEEPGESLSDCDKDDEEECLKEEDITAVQDEGEDSFVVPDGYLSENEGVEADSMSDGVEDEARCSPSCKPEFESEEFRALLRHQKYLQHLTEQALRKSQPLIISNLMHEKAELMMAEDLSGTPKIEQICLQALCMRACPGGSTVNASVICNPLNAEEEVCQSRMKDVDMPSADKSRKPKGIAAFFSKRCLPLSGDSIKSLETSPQSFQKTNPLHGDDSHFQRL